MTKTFKVIDEAGVHARPAALVVNVANSYPDLIDITYKGKTMTLKSIMLLMSLGIGCGESFDVTVVGENEVEALNSIEEVLKTNGII